MAEQRRWLADRLSRMGERIFTYLSRWEQQGGSRLAGWLKLGLLGVFVSMIGALGAQEMEPRVMCYDMAVLPDIYLTELQAAPNPTAGADSITVTARATVSEFGAQKEKSLIESVFLVVDPDTVRYQMEPIDGKLDSYDEKVQLKIAAPNCEPCTTVLRVTATSGNLTPENGSIYFMVTEGEEDDDHTLLSTPEAEIAPLEKTQE